MAAACLGSAAAFGAGPAEVSAEAVPDRTALLIHPPALHLGDIPQHELVEQSITLENRSDHAVEVLEVRDSCSGCIAYEVEGQVVPAGEMALMRVWLNPSQLYGNQSIILVVLTDELDAPQRGIEVTARVLPSWRIEGLPVRFPQVVHGRPQVWRLKIIPQVRLPEPWTRVQSEAEGISGTVWYDRDQQCYWVDIQAGPDLPPGEHETVLRLTGDRPGAPQCRIPVQASCVPPLAVAPQEILLNPVDEPQFAMVVLRQPRGEGRPFTVRMPDSLRYEIVADYSYELSRIQLVAADLAGRTGDLGSLTIRTAAPDPSQVEIPVRVRDEVVADAPAPWQDLLRQPSLQHRLGGGCGGCGS